MKICILALNSDILRKNLCFTVVWFETFEKQNEIRHGLTINVPVVFMAMYVMVLRRATSLPGAFLGFFRHFWAHKSLDFQGPPLPMPRVMMLHSSKPLSISAIKTTGTLVVLYTRVLLCTVAVCCCLLLCVVVCCCVLLSVVVGCCVLLCVRGVRRYPCSCVV